MTDLEKAIADLRRATPANSPWVAEDFECGFAGPVILALPVVVQAAASGELIPATERDAAVAAAMEAAAALCIQSAQEAKADNGTGWAIPYHGWTVGNAGGFTTGPTNDSDDETPYILATPEALAASPEVQALIVDAVTKAIKKAEHDVWLALKHSSSITCSWACRAVRDSHKPENRA
jgi:hypothetical protein